MYRWQNAVRLLYPGIGPNASRDLVPFVALDSIRGVVQHWGTKDVRPGKLR